MYAKQISVSGMFAASITLLFSMTAVASPLTPTKTILKPRGVGPDTLPTHGGGTELPSPSPGLVLKQIGLGRGTQNYTCASPNATPLAVGAVATLYDLSPLPQIFFDPLTNLAVNVDLNSVKALNFDILGHHYFTSAGVPTFDLGSKGFLSAAKQGDIPAPQGAGAGPSGTGAVDWLELGDKGGSTQVKEVYRVETIGGKAPATCQGQGAVILEQYAAQYWFFG